MKTSKKVSKVSSNRAPSAEIKENWEPLMKEIEVQEVKLYKHVRFGKSMESIFSNLIMSTGSSTVQKFKGLTLHIVPALYSVRIRMQDGTNATKGWNDNIIVPLSNVEYIKS